MSSPSSCHRHRTLRGRVRSPVRRRHLRQDRPLPALPLVAAEGSGTATHQLEPFGIQPAHRRFGRRVVVESFTVEVPARIVPPVLPRPPVKE